MKKQALIVVGCVFAGLTVVGVTAGTASGSSTSCRTYGAVGTSSASVTVPPRTTAMFDVVTATAENVPVPAYPQGFQLAGSLGTYMSNGMNPAAYNGGASGLGGVVDVWQASIPANSPSLTLTITATDPGGRVRVVVWSCPQS